MKVELYKEQIEANKNSIRDIIEHTKQQILDVRESQEKEKMQSLRDQQRMMTQIYKMEQTIEDLPNRMMDCEGRVATCEDISEKMKLGFEQIQKVTVEIENRKQDRDVFVMFRDNIEKRMLNIERTFDELNDKNKSLENWMDIYMPLRFQHQITETIKECLTPKGKHILGVVDNIMCA